MAKSRDFETELILRKKEISDAYDALERRRATDLEEMVRLKGEHRLIERLLTPKPQPQPAEPKPKPAKEASDAA